MVDEGGREKGEGGAVLERHARLGEEKQLSVTTGAFETYGSLLSSLSTLSEIPQLAPTTLH